jgi:flagellar protein FlgJ
MVDSLGTYYLDRSRYDPSSLGITAGNPKEGGRAFSELLEKAKAGLGSGDPPPAEDPPGLSGSVPKPPPARGSLSPALSSRRPVVDKTGKLYEQCEALETFLVKTLITGMRKTIQKSEFLDDSFAGKMYEDMLYDEYAKDFARNAGFGLAELAYLELTGQRGKIVNR